MAHPHIVPRTRRRLTAAVPALGAVLMATLTFLLWRTVQLEQNTRALQIERALGVAERILQRAATSHAVLDQVPAAQRLTLDQDGVVAEPQIAWLHPIDERHDEDLVVADRLRRAARAEFVDHDPLAAAREFDTLLTGPLPSLQRIVVLAAAAWQSRRADDAARVVSQRRELDNLIGELRPADLARPAIARAVAAALRLAAPDTPPAWAEDLVSFLPAGALAGIDNQAWHTQQHAVLQRRELLQRADAGAQLQRSPSIAGLAGTSIVGHDTFLWWLPPTDAAPATRDAALLTAPQWLTAVIAAGERGDLPQWPWLVEAEFATEPGADASADPAATFVGVPFLTGLRPARASALGQQPWLLPALTFLLLLAFGVAVWQQFRAAQREAAAVAAQAEFLTNVTHELKTPLASIRLLGEMLLDRRVPGREAEYHRMLVGEATRLSMLIENVLDLGRAERGERAFHLCAVDVDDAVRETVSLLQPLASQGAAEIVIVAANAPPARCDRAALVQTLVAVLDNARKYGAGPIEVATGSDGVAVRIEVRDHGAGVPEDERQRIFERFVRGRREQHGNTPGVGIGLYLARTIVRRLGGELTCITPATGPGACFRFTLPRESAA